MSALDPAAYVPTTWEIREEHVAGVFDDEKRREAYAEFDAWLAEVRADARRKTLTEAAEQYERGLRIDTIPKWLRDLAEDVTP